MRIAIVYRSMLCARTALIAGLLAITLTGCASSKRKGSEGVAFEAEVDGKNRVAMNQAQLQDALLRFGGRFTAGMVDATRDLTRSQDPVVREQALLFLLRNASSALHIVTSPVPQANLLDMVASIELQSDVVKQYWVPRVFHDGGKGLEDQLQRSRREIWKLASQVMTAQQQSQLLKIIHDWRRAHPEQIVIAGARLSDFAAEAGSQAKEDQAAAGGLIADVGSAVAATDEARLLGERALYYAQYAPFLLRIQTRLAAAETLQDVGLQVANFPQIEDRLSGLLLEVRDNLKLGDALVKDVKGALPTLKEMVFHRTQHPETVRWTSEALGHLADLAKEWTRMSTLPQNQNPVTQMAGIAAQTESNVDRLLIKVFWLAAAWFALALAGIFLMRVAFFWAKRRIERSNG